VESKGVVVHRASMHMGHNQRRARKKTKVVLVTDHDHICTVPQCSKSGKNPGTALMHTTEVSKEEAQRGARK
jgi:hypothetical protein